MTTSSLPTPTEQPDSLITPENREGATGTSFLPQINNDYLDRSAINYPDHSHYENLGRMLPPTTSVILLYDDWDRDTYPTPFGPIPHDLAVRLFYLNHPVCWHSNVRVLVNHGVETCPMHNLHDSRTSMIIIGRDRDLPALKELGEVDILARSDPIRWDRTYLLARIHPCFETVIGMDIQSLSVAPVGR